MKVLLVHTNREHLPDPVAPIGLASVADALLERGHEVQVADLCFEEEPLEAVAAQVRRFVPHAVGLSIRNIDNAAFPKTVSYMPFARHVVSAIREQTDAPLILGGSAFSLMPGELLANLDASYGVVGEGEETLPRLLDALEAGVDPAPIPGVADPRRSVGRFVPAQPLRHPAASNLRGWSLFDVDRYWQRAGQMPVQTKRGCSFGCVYCTYPMLEGRETRGREPAIVADEIEHWVSERGINHFFFVDNVFNGPIEHASLLLEELGRRDLHIGWTAYLSPRDSTPAFAALMARSGCRGIEVGVDGGSATTMRTLGKGFRPDNVRSFFADARAAGVKTCATLIIGGPGETRATLDETFDLMDEVQADAVVAMIGVRVYPGTAMWAIAIDSGQLDPAGSPLEPSFFISPELSDTDLASVLERARSRSNWAIPGAELGMDRELFARLRDKNVKGPLWRLMRSAAPAAP